MHFHNGTDDGGHKPPAILRLRSKLPLGPGGGEKDNEEAFEMSLKMSQEKRRENDGK